MRVLGIDTSSPRTSVALLDGNDVVSEADHVDPRRHVEVLAPMLDEVLRSPVDLIAVGVGPGPYTGLRAGITTAQVLGEGLGVKVVGVCSLDAIAYQVEGACVVTADARRREVYWARYDEGGLRADGPYVGAPPVADEAARRHGVRRVDDVMPDAAVIARVARAAVLRGEAVADQVPPLAPHGADGTPTAQALSGRTLLAPVPLYLRRPDAAAP